MLTPLAVILAVALVAIGAVVLVWPLVRGRSPASAERPLTSADVDPAISNLTRLRQQRFAALQLILELDAERALGNLSEEDHRAQRTVYVRRAAALIREIEGREQVLDEEIERAVKRESAARGVSPRTSDARRRAG